jgi:hypothetical protein
MTMNLAIIPVLLLAVSSLLLLITHNWRWLVIAMAVMYLAVFWLVASIWPIGMAAVKLVVGWMAAAVLGSSRSSISLLEAGYSSLSGRVFRALAGLLVLVMIYTVSPGVQTWIPAPMPIVQGGLILLGMGLLQLGMSTNPLRVVIGLLTLMAGFEMLYATTETSVLVTGLLGVVNLGLALVGAYTLVSGNQEEAL